MACLPTRDSSHASNSSIHYLQVTKLALHVSHWSKRPTLATDKQATETAQSVSCRLICLRQRRRRVYCSWLSSIQRRADRIWEFSGACHVALLLKAEYVPFLIMLTRPNASISSSNFQLLSNSIYTALALAIFTDGRGRSSFVAATTTTAAAE